MNNVKLCLGAGLLALLAGCGSVDSQWQALSAQSYEKLVDLDKDGVIIAREQCRDTAKGLAVDNNGCPSNDSKDLRREAKFYFQPGEDQLDEGERYSLKSFIEGLKGQDNWQVEIKGFADTQGDVLHNRVLAQRRVDLIARQIAGELPAKTVQLSPHVEEGDFSVKNASVTADDWDGDGILNASDRCESTDPLHQVDTSGCPVFEERLVETSLAVRYQNKSADIDPVYYPKIRKLAEFIQRYDVAKVDVLGHTSLVGAGWYNRQLSQQRAESVREMLIEQFGIPAEKLTAVGRGMSEPLDPRDDESAHSVNRRVEITLSEVLKVEKERARQETAEENRRVSVTATSQLESDNLRWHVYIMEQAESGNAAPAPNVQDESDRGGW